MLSFLLPQLTYRQTTLLTSRCEENYVQRNLCEDLSRPAQCSCDERKMTMAHVSKDKEPSTKNQQHLTTLKHHHDISDDGWNLNTRRWVFEHSNLFPSSNFISPHLRKLSYQAIDIKKFCQKSSLSPLLKKCRALKLQTRTI